MIEKVAAYMEQYHMVQKGDHICVGVSGGADSVCLFRMLEYLCHRMEFTISVVHVEHGIRGDESLADMEFVRQMAEKYDVPIAVYAYPVEKIAKEQGLSVEEAGRNLRYEAFSKEMEKYGENVKIALAHHSDDNAETMIFHLCRGSGIDGLMGIRPVRENIIRPLLCVTRDEIEAYLEKEGQTYRTDVTNADVIYSRNRIRNCIMPELEKINDKTVEHMNALAEDMAELSEYFYNEVQRILKIYMVKDEAENVEFALKGLAGYPDVLQRRVMLELLAKACGSRKDITREHTKAMQDIATGQVGRKIFLPYGMLAEKTYDTLWIHGAESEKAKSKISIKVPIDLPKQQGDDISGTLYVPEGKVQYQVFPIDKNSAKFPKNKYTKWFDYDKIKNGLYFRNREPGDYFVVDGNGHRQKLKDYLINEKVPKVKRQQLLLLADDSHILWAIGYRISEYYKVTEDTKRVLEVQFMEE